MGKRTIEIRYCDKCDKEIVGRLTLHTCPCCGKDICVECQEKEDAKHKPRERKPKTEQISPEPVILKGKRQVSQALAKKIDSEIIEIADRKGDNLSVHVPTGIGDDTEYTVAMADSRGIGHTLIGAVKAAIIDSGDRIPDCLSDYERNTIQGILDAGSEK